MKSGEKPTMTRLSSELMERASITGVVEKLGLEKCFIQERKLRV
jgi:predicted xylose isomerase-like sugar epimerase